MSISKDRLSGITSVAKILYSRRRYFYSYVSTGLIQVLISIYQMIVVIKVCGLEEWKVQALGILAGGLASTLIDRGYSSGSNSVIANLDQSELKIFFRRSLLLRFKLYFVLLVLAPLASQLLFGRMEFLFLAFLFSQSFLSLGSDWVLIALDDRRHYLRYITLPKVISSFISLAFVIILKSSFPLVLVSFVIVLLGNFRIYLLIQTRFHQVSNSKVSTEELQLGRVASAKILGDVYWLAPGLILQLLSPDFLIYFLLWDRITKFFIMPSMSASQALTGYLAKTEITVRQKVGLTLTFHLILATFFGAVGYYLISLAYPIFSEGITLTGNAIFLTACFISLVILNRGFILHVFYMSRDAVSAVLGNLFLVNSLVFLFYPNFSLTFERTLWSLVLPQFLVLSFYMIRTRFLLG